MLGDTDRGQIVEARGSEGWGMYIVYWAFLGYLGTIMRGTDATEISPNSQA